MGLGLIAFPHLEWQLLCLHVNAWRSSCDEENNKANCWDEEVENMEEMVRGFANLKGVTLIKG